ncbi:MAG: NAD(P)H-dependent oxidoreductase [Bacilli bacterium]
MSLYALLHKRQVDGAPIGVAIIGAGQMGRGMIAQISRVPGMRVASVCDVNIAVAESAIQFYLHETRRPTSDVCITTRFDEAISADGVDAVVDATGIPEVGANIALQALKLRKHLVLLNVEVDVTVGPILSQWFRAAGLVYTGSAGDEPAATLELFEFARTMGLEVVVAGKGKNNPFWPEANPDSCAKEAAGKHMSAHMLAAFQDGTKTMAEMNLLSNATGFIPDKVGMHGVHADVKSVADKLRLAGDGGVLSQYGVVEYVHGLAPGVFVIVHSTLAPVDEEMRYLSVGKGPYYTLYRPFHLASLETPLSIARAVLQNDATIAPMDGPVSETVVVAKRNIALGERIDGIGGYSVRGVLETHGDMSVAGHIPVGLITGNAVARRNIPLGTFLTEEDVEVDQSTTVWHLRKLQDRLFV